MRSRSTIVFSAVLAAACLAAAAAPTRTCNPNPWQDKVELSGTTPALETRLVAALVSPAGDPYMTDLLGNAKRIELLGRVEMYTGGNVVVLHYDPVENVEEIAEKVQQDPAIRSLSTLRAWAYASPQTMCFAGGNPNLPGRQRRIITEFYNSALDHYFLSSSPEESAFIDAGSAGPGWARTGESFVAWDPDPCGSPKATKSVYRFYGTPGLGPNSHFFTAGVEECGSLRNGTGWTYEGRAFGAELPFAGTCRGDVPVAVYRAYNMRWAQNDSNHRYTTSFATYQQMIARGWYGEGIAFCVPKE